MAFQSTHPVRGATVAESARELVEGISIHAPREGCDTATPARQKPKREFQSTHPVRGATMSRRVTCYSLSHFNPRTP